MALVPWNSFREIDNVRGELNNLFNLSPFQFLGGMNIPKADLFQTENDVVIKAEIPGVSKEDLNLYIENDVVRISGQTKRGNEIKDENVYRTERYYGSFSRTIPLPVEVKSDEAQAEYKDGILTIRIPKIEPSKIKGKRIDIQ